MERRHIKEKMALILNRLIQKKLVLADFKQLNDLNISINKVAHLSAKKIKKILSFEVPFYGKDFDSYLYALDLAKTAKQFKMALLSLELHKQRKGAYVDWMEIPQLELLLNTNSAIFDVLVNPPQEDPEASNVWDHYIVRKKDWNKLYANSNQQDYGKMMHRGIQLAAFGLREKQWSVEDMVNFLAFHRCWIAYQIGHCFFENYGQKREKPFLTSFSGEYQDLGKRLEKLGQSMPTNGLQLKIKRNEKTNEPHFMQFFTQIEEKIFPLSFVIFTCHQTLEHTQPSHIEGIMDTVYSLYKKALQEEDSKILTEQLGKIFWFVCQAKPWNLGDPSIAEMMIRTVWAIKGLESPPWKVDLIPWVEVTCQPDIEIFAKDFTCLFEWKESKEQATLNMPM
ncbi:hypothetical protein [Candidatus Protochlamydia phocaeensis]|uniref:hypothetical protein n=1 Tax=Candidatus Protochlamydia phocaeensis TaxID=1414722 RepID=UPI001896A2B3|nr:hypothetical protein [Candidatus Protochlamydia phocaeensis]